MRLDLLKYRCIESSDNESIIGYSNDIIKLYKDYTKQLIDDMQDYCMVEDLTFEIDDILQLIQKIYGKSEEWYSPQLIRVYKNVHNNYDFKVLVDED